MDTLGERVTRLRQAYGDRRGRPLSQAEAAAKLGVARKTLSAWETGAKQPSSDNILNLAAFYGVSTDHIVSGRGSEDGGDATSDRRSGLDPAAVAPVRPRDRTASAAAEGEEAPFTGIGSRIATLRRTAHLDGGPRMTQDGLARAVGAHRRTVAGWESGQHVPAGDYLERLADALGTTAEYILRGEPGDLASRLRFVAFEPEPQPEDVESAGLGLPFRRGVGGLQTRGDERTAAPEREPVGSRNTHADNQQRESSGPGRPPEHTEPWRRTTVILRDRDVAVLDRVSGEIQKRAGVSIPRSGIVRALVQALAESAVDVSQSRNEDELAKLLAAKLAGG